MRKMTNGTTVIEVIGHIITRNGWEYYVTPKGDKWVRMCLVVGYETELGDVSFREIGPYIISKTAKLTNVLPAKGWRWVA